MVAVDQMHNATFGAGGFQNLMPRNTGTLGDGGAGGEFGESKNLAGNAQLRQTGKRQPGFVSRFGAQAMIDNQSQTIAAHCPRPVAHQQS